MKSTNIFIDISRKSFNYYNNSIFKDLVGEFLEKNPEIILDNVIKEDLATVLLEVLTNNLDNVLDNKKLYNILEQIYDFWRNHKRFLVADMTKSFAVNEDNFLHIFDEFNNYVLTAYRNICANLLGKKFTILRELPAGANAFLLVTKVKNYMYPSLKTIPFIAAVAFRPPFVVYSKSNKRSGIFPIIKTNPMDSFESEGHWYAFPLLVGNSKVNVYFKDEYISLGLALSNLFTHNDNFANDKPDIIVLFGSNTEDGIYYDEKENLYIASLKDREEIDYFGYMKKIILTAHNIKMIKQKMLPLHGAGVSLILKDHSVKNVILIGDSGAGKSETLEALRNIGSEYILDITTVFDDMGTLVIDKDELKAYGTEIGAFVRIDDLENGYAYRVFDRAIFINPNQLNARLVLPVSTHDDIINGFKPDMILYANNYEDKKQKIIQFSNAIDALNVFRRGMRMAKGTTSENGLVSTFFANPFGPVQLKEKTEILLNEYFNKAFENNVFVGQIYTGLGLKNPQENVLLAAKSLLELLKEK